VVGSGVFGTVFMARDRETDGRVVIKRLAVTAGENGVPASVIREVSLLRDLVHPNIVQLKDLQIVGPDGFDLIFEYIPDDLHRVLKGYRREGTQLPMEKIVLYWQGLLDGIHACHTRMVIHRDLKPQNVLIHPTDGLKICDFGLARAVGGEGSSKEEVNLLARQQQPARHLTGHVVTRWYRAPELILLQEEYTELIDMWSVGCIYAELLGMYEGIDPRDRGPLFKGTACFPLSPHGKGQELAPPAAGAYRHAKEDQLEMIFNVIGTPTDAEVDMMHDAEAKKYLKSFTSRRGDGFKKRIPQADSEDRDVLRQLICFHPEKRPSAEQLLDHKIFADVRERHKEVKAKSVVTLSFREEAEISKHRLKEYMVKEMRKFRAPASSTAEAEKRAGGANGGRPSLLTGGRAAGSKRSSTASKSSLPPIA